MIQYLQFMCLSEFYVPLLPNTGVHRRMANDERTYDHSGIKGGAVFFRTNTLIRQYQE